MNNIGFKVFMLIPFLFELRTLMDWVWTDTSMTLFDWLKMEDIFVNVYQLKVCRVFVDKHLHINIFYFSALDNWKEIYQLQGVKRKAQWLNI